MSDGLVAITGASSGIGEAIARRLGAAGRPLLLMARRLGRMEELGIPGAVCRQVDVTDMAQIQEAIAAAEAVHGPVDTFVNNAGMMLLGTVADQEPEEWRRMIDVNLVGLLYGTRAVLPAMKSRGRGTIIQIASTAGLKTYPYHAVYSSTKFAVRGFAESLREEVSGQGIRVTVISPGAVETELLSHTTSEDIRAWYEGLKVAIGGAIDPDAVARAVSYVLDQPQHICIRELVLARTAQGP